MSWQAQRVQPGLYLKISRDRKTLYRVHKYHEDGSLSWVDDKGKEHKVKGDRWAADCLIKAPAEVVTRNDKGEIITTRPIVALADWQLRDLGAWEYEYKFEWDEFVYSGGLTKKEVMSWIDAEKS